LSDKKKINGKIFNVGGGETNSRNLIEAIHEIEEKTNKKAIIEYQMERPGDQPYFVSDNTMVMSELGWKPKISVDIGLKTLITWLMTIPTK